MVSYSLRDAARGPGFVSALRLPLAVAFPWTVARPAAALAVLAAAAATDVLDGWLARRLHEATPTGAVVDALMDKAFVAVVVVTLVATRLLSPVQAVMLGARDLLELPLAIGVVGARRVGRHTRKANRLGKLATVGQFVTIGADVVRWSHVDLLVVATAALGVIAGVSYWVDERRALARPDD